MSEAPGLDRPAGNRDALRAAIRSRAILRSQNQRLISPGGSSNKWLLDMRRISADGALLGIIADLFWERFAGRLPFQVAGMEMAAIPIIAAILMKGVERGTPVNGFYIRKERKTYGAGRLVDGVVNEAPVILVDDILNSGKSFEKSRAVIAEYGCAVGAAFAVVDFRSHAGLTWRSNNKIPVVALFGLDDFDLSLGRTQTVDHPHRFRVAWNFASPDANFFHLVPKSFPACDGERVYFGSDSGQFWCLDAREGTPLWKFRITTPAHKNIWSAPALDGGRVFFGGYDGNVYCLDAVTGKEIWRFTGAEWVGSSPALAPELGLLFIGLEYSIEGKRGAVIALDMATGRPVWHHFTKRYTHASPAYCPERQLVACGSNDNELFLFDARSGSLRWRFETRSGEDEKGSIRHAPAFGAGGSLIVTGCANGCIYVIDVETGRELWSVETGNTIYSVPLIAGGKCYLGSTDKYLYVLDLGAGRLLRRILIGSKLFSPPRLLNGRVYFGACNGRVYELDPLTDDILDTLQLPDAITNAVTYSEKTGLFYALTYMNQLFAFKAV